MADTMAALVAWASISLVTAKPRAVRAAAQSLASFTQPERSFWVPG
jgi:hypothetical protein